MLATVTPDLGESILTNEAAMTTPEFAHLEVVRLGRHDWRVSDNTLEQGDPARLLGFIERLKRGYFEVLWISDPPEWAYTVSLATAVAALAGADSFVGVRRVNRDQSVRTVPALPLRPTQRRTKSDA
jgi:hypothetical protein